ncbi:hypothetical protein [Pantoea sp. B65]|uniref:hypothetical protein n=1 Tax=Pantoea sp. B65 TaxID=2813359 RepID=UPI0039B439F9
MTNEHVVKLPPPPVHHIHPVPYFLIRRLLICLAGTGNTQRQWSELPVGIKDLRNLLLVIARQMRARK